MRGASKSEYKSAISGLKDIYKNKIRPAEEYYKFSSFYNSPPISDAEFDARPLILLIGQYSTGKTSFIESLLNCGYSGSHIGPEPTTDRFFAVMYGTDSKVIPGTAAVSHSDKPFKGLGQFGSSFLNKFQISINPNPFLETVGFVDTPGVLSGEKQRLGRSYDFTKICSWFTEKADLILLFFDAHKLDISDELKEVITHSLKGHDDKIRVILNKADIISNQQLMRVYGALMWSLGKIIHTPEVVRVYTTSFMPAKGTCSENNNLIRAEVNDLIDDILSLPHSATMRKINDLLKRCRLISVHVHIISRLREEMPFLLGKGKRQKDLISNLDKVFTEIQQSTNISPGDFPDIMELRERLSEKDFANFPRFEKKIYGQLQSAMDKDIPGLMEAFPQEAVIRRPNLRNPFDPTSARISVSFSDEDNDKDGVCITPEKLEGHYRVSQDDFHRYKRQFFSFSPQVAEKEQLTTRLSGQQIKTMVQGVRAPSDGEEGGNDIRCTDADLSQIWKLCNESGDGSMGFIEYIRFSKVLETFLSTGFVPKAIPGPLVSLNLSSFDVRSSRSHA